MTHSQSTHGSDRSSNSSSNDNLHNSTKQQQSSPIPSNQEIASPLPHVGSLSSLSSDASSYNTFGTNQRNEEIFENESLSHIMNDAEPDRDPPLLSSKSVSPTSSPSHHQNHNDSNSMHQSEPILSALTELYTHNLSNTQSKELSPSPRDDIKHQDRKHQQNENSNVHTIDNMNHTNDTNPAHNSRASMTSIGNAIFNGFRTVHNYIPYNQQPMAFGDDGGGNLTDNDAYHDEKKEETNTYDRAPSLDSILSSPHFMDNAIAMYGHLDNALNNINEVKTHQLQQIKCLRQRKKRKRRNLYSNIPRENDNDNESDNDNDTDSVVDVNEHVANTMKTLISSTTKMGDLFASSSDKQSVFGVLFDKLSSSIAYMSYISVSTITPFIYNMVEAVLLELYATIKDIIEYYDPDPKNNVLWKIIDKMNEIVEAIHGLLALSDCFYEISSDDDDDDDDDSPSTASHSFFKEKEKKD